MNSRLVVPRASRRAVLGLMAGAAAVSGLSACGGGDATGGADGAASLTFWDMPWAGTGYNDAAAALSAGFSGSSGSTSMEYQIIQWSNFYQTFASAIASGTGPAVSTGGGMQPFQFAEQGAIAYADDVLEQLRSDGTLDDFLPGTIEPLQTEAGLVGVPWMLDLRVWWARQSILDEVGVTAPTNWDEFFDVGERLLAAGYTGFGTGAGSGSNYGPQSIISMMFNNGGGLFTEDGELDVVYERNVEAVEFVLECVRAGIVDPSAVSYTSDNLLTQWTDRRIAMGLHVPGLDESVDAVGDLTVMSPMAGPHGDFGAYSSINSIMMYADTPSLPETEGFVRYFIENMGTLWQQNAMGALPVRQSIVDLPEFQANAQKAKIVAEYQPISKTYAARGTALFADIAVVDGGQALAVFAQKVLTASTDARTALEELQTDLEGVMN